MKDEYLQQLAPNVRQLVAELEAFAGLEIGVESDASPVSPTDPNPDRLAARITAREAAILVRNGAFDPHGALHELLHIRRFWVEAIPQIIPLDGAPENNWQVTGQIENALEHLLIVPQEAEFGYEPYAYWNETERRNFGRYPWPEMTDAWARRKNCLLGALGVRYLVTDPAVKEMAIAVLKREGLYKEAWSFAKRVHGYRRDKAKMLGLTVDILGIPRNDVKLIRFLVKARQTYQLPF